MFVIYGTESLQGCTYLRIALRDIVMDILGDDELDLEIEPTLLWSRCVM